MPADPAYEPQIRLDVSAAEVNLRLGGGAIAQMAGIAFRTGR